MKKILMIALCSAFSLQSQTIEKIVPNYVLIDTSQPSWQIGTHLLVLRQNHSDLQRIARLEIVQIQEGKAAAKIIENYLGARVQIGDLVRLWIPPATKPVNRSLRRTAAPLKEPQFYTLYAPNLPDMPLGLGFLYIGSSQYGVYTDIRFSAIGGDLSSQTNFKKGVTESVDFVFLRKEAYYFGFSLGFPILIVNQLHIVPGISYTQKKMFTKFVDVQKTESATGILWSDSPSDDQTLFGGFAFLHYRVLPWLSVGYGYKFNPSNHFLALGLNIFSIE